MQPISGGYNIAPTGLLTLPANEQRIADLALTEAISRLKLKFPGCSIEDHEVKFEKIVPITFNSGALGCKTRGFSTCAFVKGFIASFKYQDELFPLHTKDGKYFVSDQLCFDPYPQEILAHVTAALSNEIGRPVTVENISLESVEEEAGFALSYEACNKDISAYIDQTREVVYLIALSFEGNRYEYCLNEMGQPRALCL